MSSSGGRDGSAVSVTPNIIGVGNPAAGADINAGNASTAKLLMAVTATLTTSATVANRVPILTIFDASGRILFQSAPPPALGASTAMPYCWAPGLPVGAGSPGVLPLPSGLVVPATGFVRTVTSGIQAGDQWSLVVIIYAG